MVKNLSCVSCAARNVFPINSLMTVTHISSNLKQLKQLKFIYSEKATKFCKICTLLLSYVVPVKSKAFEQVLFALVHCVP